MLSRGMNNSRSLDAFLAIAIVVFMYVILVRTFDVPTPDDCDSVVAERD
jgi:hypothetical protein